MKNHIILYIFMISLSSFSCLAQEKAISLNENKTKTSDSNTIAINSNKKIKYYHVEEVVSLKFGGYKTVYDVVNRKIISTYDLGPNGKRTITPIYGNEDQSLVPLKQTILVTDNDQSIIPALEVQKNLLNTKKPISQKENISNTPKKELIITSIEVPKKKETPLNYQITLKKDTMVIYNKPKVTVSGSPKRTDAFVYIDIIKTYERMNDKGYVSIDMLKKVGNSYFFDNDFEKAEKCYAKLFSLTINLEPDYYYRYSIILKSMGDIQKSDEFLKKFNQLSSLSSR